jgi:DNA-binding transcriptional LysR family regulator
VVSLSPQPELRSLRTFVAVAEELHFTRAAERLHLTQQALSTQIRHLEESLGVSLFTRTTRKVELTPAGRTLLAHAIPLLASASRAWDDVAQVGSGDTGTVLLSYAPTVRRELLPLLLEELELRHPALEVRSCEVWWGDSALADGLIEVSISRSRPPEDDANIAAIAILNSPLGLVLGRDHPLAQGDTVDVEALDGEALKLWPRAFSATFYDTIVASLRGRGFTGAVEELAIFGSGILMHDPTACAEIAEGRAFGIGFRGQYTELEPELVWREIAPVTPIPMNLCWRRDASAGVRNLVGVVLDVAQRKQWLPADARREAARLLTA